jgi:hypothetical protein
MKPKGNDLRHSNNEKRYMDNPQAHFLSPRAKSTMIGYERVSETERVLVNNDSLINLNWLKIQSVLY